MDECYGAEPCPLRQVQIEYLNAEHVDPAALSVHYLFSLSAEKHPISITSIQPAISQNEAFVSVCGSVGRLDS